jgi:hypothetical protein
MRDTKRASLRQEAEVAAENDGIPNPGSGNGWRHKNDVRSARFSFECKITQKDHYSLKLRELETAERYAVTDGKLMAFVTDINGRRYYTISELTWGELVPEESRQQFLFELHTTNNKSARLDREELHDLETVALAMEREAVLINVIQGHRFYTMRDYTWHMIRGD